MARGLCCCALLLCAAAPARALHGVGIPHYSYDEQDPATPILTYDVSAGPYQVRATVRPGVLRPGAPCTLRVDVRDRETGLPFDGAVHLTVAEDQAIVSRAAAYGPVVASLQEGSTTFEPRFPAETNYVARLEFEARGATWRIDLPVVVGEPGSPWAVVGGTIAALAVFLVAVGVARARMRGRP